VFESGIRPNWRAALSSQGQSLDGLAGGGRKAKRDTQNSSSQREGLSAGPLGTSAILTFLRNAMAEFYERY